VESRGGRGGRGSRGSRGRRTINYRPMPHSPFPAFINKIKNRVFTRFLTTLKSSVF